MRMKQKYYVAADTETIMRIITQKYTMCLKKARLYLSIAKSNYNRFSSDG